MLCQSALGSDHPGKSVSRATASHPLLDAVAPHEALGAGVGVLSKNPGIQAEASLFMAAGRSLINASKGALESTRWKPCLSVQSEGQCQCRGPRPSCRPGERHLTPRD